MIGGLLFRLSRFITFTQHTSILTCVPAPGLICASYSGCYSTEERADKEFCGQASVCVFNCVDLTSVDWDTAIFFPAIIDLNERAD